MKNMRLLKFNEILNLSQHEILEKIIHHTNQLYFLQFKKITRQKFKPSDLKKTKNQISQLKAVVTARLSYGSDRVTLKNVNWIFVD